MEATLTTRCLQPSTCSPSPSTVTSQQTLTDQNISQELSPDSGNGEELDEADPLKTSPKCFESQNDQDDLINLNEFTLTNPLQCVDKEKDMVALPTQAQDTKQSLLNSKSEKGDKPFNSEGETVLFQEKEQLGFPKIPKDCVVHYSDAFSNKLVSSSLIAKCSSSFNCGPFSGACTPVLMSQQAPDMNGPFSLPEGRGFLREGVFTTVPYQLNCDKTKTGPFSLPVIEPTRISTTGTCTNIYYPEYYNYRNRLVRRYTHPEVVKTQPTSGGLLTTSCDLMTSPPGQCACINPGTSHACASRPTHKLSPGVLNPVFDKENCGKRNTSASMPSTPRKFSLDQNLFLKDFTLPEFSAPVIPVYKNEDSNTISLDSSQPECQSDIPLSSTSETLESEDNNIQSHQNTDTSSSAGIFTCSTTTCSSISGEGIESLSYKDLGKDLPSLNEMAKGLGVVRTNVKPPVLTSPDWFSFLTPSQESCTQKLFTPGDLRDELMYPAPYGVSSEIYQNLNAQEADFVLQKPNRKPRTEPLPPVSKTETTNSSMTTLEKNTELAQSNGQSTHDNKSEQLLQVSTSSAAVPQSPARIIEPLATEDEEALKQGAQENRKLSLSERRKTSIDKIYIPKAVDPVSVLDVKIDNFDRDEYVNYKKTFGENDALVQDCPLLPCTSILRDLSRVSKNKRNYRGKNYKGSESDSSRKTSIITDQIPEVSVDDVTKTSNQVIESRTRKTSHTHGTGDDVETNNRNSTIVKDKNCKQSHSYNNKISEDVNVNKNKTHNRRTRKNAVTKIHSPSKENPFLYQDPPMKKENTFRKQSLPTEELFGTRRPKLNRRSSLNPPSDSMKQGRSHRKSSFDPVQETEEAPFLFDDDAPRRRTLWHRRHFLNARNGDDFFVPPSEKKESPERSLRARSKIGERKRDRILTSRKPEWKSYCENAITVKANTTRRNESEVSSQNSDGHRKIHNNKSISSRHRVDSSNSDEASNSQGKEYSKHYRKYSGHAEKDESGKYKGRMSKSSSSPRKGRRQAREGHVNPMAELSSMGFESSGDLFANKACPSGERAKVLQGVPLVPYEPLVEKVTSPTSPEVPTPRTGATRKQQNRRRSKKRRGSRPLERHRFASPSSSSSSASSSRSSSSSPSTRLSMSSSSSSSDSSSSSSSSSSDSTSSSSDSSDFEDLIL